MPEKELYRQKIEDLKICVLIPTYNNCKTLGGIIERVLEYTRSVIVVDDGSTDGTKNILENFKCVEVISFKENKGKGYALRKGFEMAIQQGYRYALTIDSDGQHAVDDLVFFIEKIEKEPDSLVVGARNMSSEGVPRGSSFGNRFSNFWFSLETGTELPDTQSGFRLYPLQKLKGMKFHTVKYEFEIEVLVRAVWKGISAGWVPVSVYYAPKEERVSHFRPFTDFARVSVLNTVLVFLALFYYRPALYFRQFSKENVKKFYKDQIQNNPQTNIRIILSVMLGAFMGVAPLWGYQIILTIIIAQFLRLNKVIAVVVSNISIPPMIPFWIWSSFKLGELAVKGAPVRLVLSRNIDLKMIWENITQYAVGAVILGLLLAILFGLATYFLLWLLKNKQKTKEI